MLGRLAKHKPDLLVVRVGNSAGQPLRVTGEKAKEAIPTSPLLTKRSQEWILNKENMKADFPLNNLSLPSKLAV